MNNLFEPVITVECWNQFKSLDANGNQRNVLYHINGVESDDSEDNLIWISMAEYRDIMFDKKFGKVNFNVSFNELLNNFKRKS